MPPGGLLDRTRTVGAREGILFSMKSDISKSSKTFCIFPWVHLSIATTGTVRLCCRSDRMLTDESGAALSVYTHTMDEIWNSAEMRAIRGLNTRGGSDPGCKVCFKIQSETGASHRILANNEWESRLGSLDPIVKQSEIHGFILDRLPRSYHLLVGTKCNLKCRMCSPIFSSQVASDPVQSKWWPPLEFMQAEPIVWSAGWNRIGPEIKQGVSYRGFHDFEAKGRDGVRWTDGKANISIIVPDGLVAKRLHVRCFTGIVPGIRGLASRTAGRSRWRFKARILVNEEVLFNGEIRSRTFDREFGLSGHRTGKVDVSLESETFKFKTEARNVGLAIEEIKVFCAPSEPESKAERAGCGHSRTAANPWYEDHEWLMAELLRNPERLQEIHFSGGEPMIQPSVESIMDFLIENNTASNMTLRFNTNCTVLPDRVLKKMGMFKECIVAASVDAYGKYWEYIRYPGKWGVVERNLVRLSKLANGHLTIVPVLQAYNLLNILELFDLADRIGAECSMYPLADPMYLSATAMPMSARRIAARKFEARSAQEKNEGRRAHYAAMAEHLEKSADECTRENVRNFVKFTKELDMSRNQDFSALHPELARMIKETGFVR